MTTTTYIPPSTRPARRTGKKRQPCQKIRQLREERRQERIRIKNRSQLRIAAIVERVASTCGVCWRDLFAPDRGSDVLSSARVLAMGLCAALEVPHFLTAKAFSRDWSTVYSAGVRCSILHRSDSAFRTEWDALVKACGDDGV